MLVKPVANFFRAGGARDWADAGCDGGGNGALGTLVFLVFAFGAENSEYCPAHFKKKHASRINLTTVS